MDETKMAAVVQGILETMAAEWGSKEVQDLIDLTEADQEDAEALYHARIRSFKDGMIMTTNAGFTVRTEGGSEYQVSFVRSK